MSRPQMTRCAIYTRKSSDEGLDQAFNSLDAQRAAGEAYIRSQASEGWTVIATRYDDGGFSGGSMERPALRQLLDDIAVGLVDVVVVYKIDRLTRSLADFSRIVEIFEKHGSSFVSVTQSFNTTNSMGRLMLNVLLSFAQFEREVTGERIRDKIAASKAKGMWMGGLAPLGYDLPASGTRKLQINETEAETVRNAFTRYLELGSVHALQRELAEQGVLSKRRVSATGKVTGGEPFSRGALFHLLRNRIYLGQIVHRDQAYPGEHRAIIDADLYDRVQQMLNANSRRHRTTPDCRVARAPLTGKLFDATGEPMSPTFSRGQSGRTYRYYVSASLLQGGSRDDQLVRRLPAPLIERVLDEAVERWLGRADNALLAIRSARLVDHGIIIEVSAPRSAELALRLLPGERVLHHASTGVSIHMPLAMPLRGGRRAIAGGAKHVATPDPVLISALRKAHRLTERERGIPLVPVAPASPYDRKILTLAFLAPDLQRDIIAGLHPPSLNLERLMKREVPIAWAEQRAALGWKKAD